MPLIQIIVLALGLAMDAFAVCLVAGSTGRTHGLRPAFRLSFHFALFQFVMPVLGWLAGSALEGLIRIYDHWIAFGLLAFVGFRMIDSGLRPRAGTSADPSRGWMLVALSVAVSVDALAVGLSLALLGTSVWYPAMLIGVVTGALSLVGLRLGTDLGRKVGQWIQIAGGILLIAIGLEIVVRALGAMP